MAKLWSLALALLLGAGVWAAPVMAEPVTESSLGDHGLKFTSDNFEVAIKSRVQFRMTYQNEVANGESGTNGRDFINFRVRRAKTEFKGHIWQKDFQYKLLLNWTSLNVENAVFTWAWRDEMNINAGQDKLNWNWEEYTSSGSQNFVERSAVNEVFNQDYAKGIWINGKFGEETPWIKYWFGIYNGVLAGNNDFRNADMAQRADVFGALVDNEMMINLRIETHPMGEVKNKMYDDRGEDSRDKVLLAVGLGLNWFMSGFNDAALRPDTVGTPTASGRSRTSQDTLAVTLDAHLRAMGLSVDVAFFFRHTEFHNRGASDFNPTNPARNGIGNLTDVGITFEVAYFIIASKMNVGIRVDYLNADEFWAGGGDNKDLGIRPDTMEAGIVVNYFVQGDNLKLTLDISYVDQQLVYSGSSAGLLGVYNAPPVRAGSAGGNAENADHNALWIIRIQIQWIF
jgi:hypothetical protein